jgi:16S rRNA (cytidine1402-2'-O)-methyltransferase
MENKGKLWIVSTPIGNLEDITFRAVKILQSVNLILAEDTRRTKGLLTHLGITEKKLISLNEHNQEKRIARVLEGLENGEAVALVSDAGMPVISDPGYKLINACIDHGFEVDSAPGPSAVTTAVALSGFPGSKFTFLGFLPRGKKRRRIFRKIAEGLYEDSLIVFFESPYRLLESLKDWLEIVGDRRGFVGRELTKIHQELVYGTLSEILEHFSKEKVLGEITVVISSKGESGGF